MMLQIGAKTFGDKPTSSTNKVLCFLMDPYSIENLECLGSWFNLHQKDFIIRDSLIVQIKWDKYGEVHKVETEKLKHNVAQK